MDDIREYILATLDGTAFFSSAENDFNSVAVAAFTKLAELHKESDDSNDRIAIEVKLSTKAPGSTERKIFPMGFLCWNLQSKP